MLSSHEEDDSLKKEEVGRGPRLGRLMYLDEKEEGNKI